MNRRFRRFGWVMFLLVFALSSVPQGAARADIGWPPVNPGGSSLEAPDEARTNVRMLAEEVNLVIEPFQRAVRAGAGDEPGNHMRGRVEAVFQMRNLGEKEESFDVWFPLAASLRYKGLLPYTPENIVRDFQVWVDQKPVRAKQISAPDLGDPTQPSAWARFPITFPAGQDVVVRVTYTIYPSGRRPFGGFEYILQTGAGWKDTIGKAVVKVTLPDAVTAENVSLAGKSIEGLPIAPQPAGYVIEDNVIRWEFTNLEPSAQDNIHVDVLEPERYRSLLQARARAASTPDSARAQLELARASMSALMVVKATGEHGGGKTLEGQANAAYQRALELAPDEADIYVEYARWLLRGGGWGSLAFLGICPEELCQVVSRGLELFPANAELVKLDTEIRQMISEAAPFATQNAANQSATASAAGQQATRAAVQATATALALRPTATQPAPTATRAAATATLAPPTRPPTALLAATELPPPAGQNSFGSLVAAWFPAVLIGLALLMVLLGLRARGK